MNIKCRYSGLKPSCAVIVATGTVLVHAFVHVRMRAHLTQLPLLSPGLCTYTAATQLLDKLLPTCCCTLTS